MRRLLWLGVGIGVGALVVRQVTRAMQAYSPGGLASSARNSAAGLLDSVHDFITDVREGMAEREEQIRAEFFVEAFPDAGDDDEMHRAR